MRSFYLALLLSFLGTCVSAQTRHVFEGMARTRVQYLADNIAVFDGERKQQYLTDSSEISPEHLGRLRQLIVNLPAFTNAKWQLDTVRRADGTAGTLVRWSLEEGRTIFPIINFGGIQGNTFYQVGVNDIHFRGRGQNLTAFYQNIDGEHNYSVLLRNQNYRGSRWGYSVESRRYAAIEPVFFRTATVDYQYVNQSFGLGVSYAFLPRETVGIGVSTFRERYRKVTAEDDPATPGPEAVDQRKYLLRLGHTRDRIDRHDERNAGSHHRSTFQLIRTVGEPDNFVVGWHDLRYYRLLGERTNLALRLRAGLSTNNESPFAPFVLDSQVNIRGSGNRIDRGTGQLVLNLEYRYSVWRENKNRFAAQLVAFSDLGTWRNPGGAISDFWDQDNLRHFVGGGVRLIYLKAFNAALRADYGVDVYNTNQHGLVVGFGQYF